MKCICVFWYIHWYKVDQTSHSTREYDDIAVLHFIGRLFQILQPVVFMDWWQIFFLRYIGRKSKDFRALIFLTNILRRALDKFRCKLLHTNKHTQYLWSWFMFSIFSLCSSGAVWAYNSEQVIILTNFFWITLSFCRCVLYVFPHTVTQYVKCGLTRHEQVLVVIDHIGLCVLYVGFQFPLMLYYKYGLCVNSIILGH